MSSPVIAPPRTKGPGISLADVPEFEKMQAARMQIGQGNLPDTIAHTSGNHIYVDDPSRMTQGVLNHEVVHGIQNSVGNVASTPDDATQKYYDYGGISGLHGLKSIATLNNEQQASIPEDYTAQVAAYSHKRLTPLDARHFDQMNAAYARPIHQLANMAAPGIDVTPQPPGPPPAALTGMLKPLPEIGGQTLYVPRR